MTPYPQALIPLLGIIILGILGVVLSPAAHAAPGAGPDPKETHPGISLEPMYSEAVLAYNGKQIAEALKILDAILKIKGDYLEALELKALVLKSSGKQAESRSTYEALIKSAPPEKTPPYHFELGIIEYNDKKPEAALPHFEQSIAGKFNVDASHFFLGLIGFNLASKTGMLGYAENHFRATADGKTDELKAPAHYYLGLIAYKNNYGSQGTHELIEARKAARSLPDNAIAKDIEKAVNAALAPYGKAQWFGNVTVLESYNGNVSSLPNSAIAPEQTSGKKTVQTMLVAGFGRMSSPLNTFQWVGSYRGTFNLNYNSDARALQFLTHTGDLYFTYDPLARAQYGLKLEYNASFSDQAKTGFINFAIYSMTAEIGLYSRREIARGMMLSGDAGYRFQKYYLTYDQSGPGMGAHLNWNWDRGSAWINPSATVGFDRNAAQTGTYRNWTLSTMINDNIKLGSSNTITVGYMLNFIQYPDFVGGRSDKLMSFRLNWIHQLASKWTIIADLSYQTNISSIPDLYSYSQPVLSAGVGFNF